MIQKQKQMISLMQEILQESYKRWQVQAYSLEENLKDHLSNITCTLQDDGGEVFVVAGQGVGLIDAFYDALVEYLANDYPSLRSIKFSQFNVRGLIESPDQQSTRAEAEATVGIRNSEGREFVFQAREGSISYASLQATIQAAEYFVNSEQTFVRLHEILSHYRKEGRTDLVDKYTELMTQVVQNTSYSEVLEQIKAQL